MMRADKNCSECTLKANKRKERNRVQIEKREITLIPVFVPCLFLY